MFKLRIQLNLLEYPIAVEATNILATNRAEVHQPTTYIYLQPSFMIHVNYSSSSSSSSIFIYTRNRIILFYLQLLHSISILPHYCFDLLSWNLTKWPLGNDLLSENDPQNQFQNFENNSPAKWLPNPPPPPLPHHLAGNKWQTLEHPPIKQQVTRTGSHH